MRKTSPVAMLGLLGWLIPAMALGGPPEPQEEATDCADAPCAAARARWHLAAGKADQAIAVLKAAVGTWPDDGDLSVLLGAAYLAAGNRFWAIRTLTRRVQEAPGDCEARAFLAWAHLGQADLEAAIDAAGDPGCSGPDGGRLAMVRGLIHGARGDRDAAAEALFAARRTARLWPEDRRALPAVTRRALPDGLPEWSWRLEIAGGYTSNALLGSPTDPASGAVRKGGSVLGQADFFLRLAPWVHRWVRPVLEVQVRGSGFWMTEVRDLSWIDLSGRLGLSIGKVLPRALIAWRPDWLVLGQGDRYDPGPVLYFTAHRAEAEVDIAPWMVLFAGGGRRIFRETARTRWEADLGLGGRAGLARGVTLLWAAMGRVYRANASAWNLYGGSALLAVQGRLPRGLLAKGGLSMGIDAYPESTGYAPWGEPSRSRRDLLLKPGLSIWSPAWSGLRMGVQYDFSWRDSTLPRYGFSDHRATIRLSWAGDSDLLRPRAAPGTPVADLPLGGEGGEDGLDRVQDLLRQDEQVQRSSSCVQ